MASNNFLSRIQQDKVQLRHCGRDINRSQMIRTDKGSMIKTEWCAPYIHLHMMPPQPTAHLVRLEEHGVGSRARCSEEFKKDARNKPVLHDGRRQKRETTFAAGTNTKAWILVLGCDIWLVWAVECCIRCMEFQVDDLKIRNKAMVELVDCMA